MKKTIFCIISLMLLVAVFGSAVSVSAAEDRYTAANDGELLYTVDFSGTDGFYKPEVVNGNPIIEVDSMDHGRVTISVAPEHNKTRNYWGGDVVGLPLNEGTAYTMFYTVTRASIEGAVGFYPDGQQHGMYGYSYNQRFLSGGSTLAGHSTIKYDDKGIKAEGNIFGGEKTTSVPSVQHYALEVNGQKSTLRMYVMTTENKWELVDETFEGDIPVFYSENLGVILYVYYSDMPMNVSDVSIYKGMTVSGEKLSEIVTTEAPKTTAKPETTKAPAVDTKPAEITTVADVTTKPDDVQKPAETSAKPQPKKGCDSSIAIGAVAIIAILGVAVVSKKK